MSYTWLDLPQIPWEEDPNLPKKTIKVGGVVVLHGLKNRPELNQTWAVILGKVKKKNGEVRWKVKPLFHDTPFGIKTDNLKLPGPPYETHPHPCSFALIVMDGASKDDGSYDLIHGIPHRVKARGVTYPDDPVDEQARKIVELLTCGNGDIYNCTMMLGTVRSYSEFIPQSSMSCLGLERSDHAAAIVTLADMCGDECRERLFNKELKHSGWVEATVFALLEAYPSSIQAIFGLAACTPYIGPPDAQPSIFKNAMDVCCPSWDLRSWKLTPAQTHEHYCMCVHGCYALLNCLAELTKGTELFKVFIQTIEKHELFPLFLERSFQLVAREIMDTKDGREVGPIARILLSNWAALDDLPTDISNMLVLFSDSKALPKDSNLIRSLLNKQDVNSSEELCEFICSVMKPCLKYKTRQYVEKKHTKFTQ